MYIQSGDTALIFASRWGYTAVVKLLLEAGASTTPKDTVMCRNSTALDRIGTRRAYLLFIEYFKPPIMLKY